MTREDLKALDMLNEFKDKEDRWGRTSFTSSEYCEALAELQKLQEENEHLKNMLQAHTKDK